LQIVKLKIHEAISEQETGLAKKEQEIMLITEKNLQLQKQLNSLKSAYESADQEDTIMNLRQNLAEQNSQQIFLQKRIDALHKSSETHSGALEVFEKMVEKDGLLREIISGLSFKKMELGLKLKTLTKQLQGNQQLKEKKRKAYEFLKAKLEKEENAMSHRIGTAEEEKKMVDKVIIEFFERINRATAKIFNESGGSVQALMRWAQEGAASASPASSLFPHNPYQDIDQIGSDPANTKKAFPDDFNTMTLNLTNDDVKGLIRKDLRKLSLASADPTLTPLRSSLSKPAVPKSTPGTQRMPMFGDLANLSKVGSIVDSQREQKEDVLFLNRGFPLRSAAPTPKVKFRRSKR